MVKNGVSFLSIFKELRSGLYPAIVIEFVHVKFDSPKYK